MSTTTMPGGTTDQAERRPTPTDAGLPGVRAVDELARWDVVAGRLRANETKRDRREFLKTLGLVIAAPATLSGWAAWAVSPRIEQRTEFVPIREDGTPARAFRYEELPPEALGDVAVNALWHYVQCRESHSSGMADYAWRVVSVLSDERVRREYQERHDPKSKTSPWAVFGDHTIIEVEYDSHDDLVPPTGYTGPPPGYVFRFWRTVRSRLGPPSRDMWSASVRMHRNVPGIDARQRYAFNAPGVQVWEYPGGRPVGPGSRGRRTG